MQFIKLYLRKLDYKTFKRQFFVFSNIKLLVKLFIQAMDTCSDVTYNEMLAKLIIVKQDFAYLVFNKFVIQNHTKIVLKAYIM